MKHKYFFKSSDPENCYLIEYWKDELKKWDEKEIELIGAEIEYDNGYFFCTEFDEPGESQESDCGKLCKKYNPRNGKNGRCKFSNNTYEMSDAKYILNKNGKLKVIKD